MSIFAGPASVRIVFGSIGRCILKINLEEGHFAIIQKTFAQQHTFLRDTYPTFSSYEIDLYYTCLAKCTLDFLVVF